MQKIAVIGTGRIGTHHVEALVNDVIGAEVTALVDPALSRAQELAKQFGIPNTYASLEEALADGDFDAIVISTPVATHLPLIEMAAKAGKAVFTEKPLGGSLQEARQIEEIINSTKVLFQVGFNRRFSESWAKAHALAAEGAIGTIQRYHSITRDPGPYGGNPDATPVGTIFKETLIHDFDTINWFMEGASPVSVYAAADALIAPEAKEKGFLDSAVVTITYDNGAIATAEASFSALYGYDLRGEAFGSKGMLQMGVPENTACRAYTAAGLSVTTDGTDTSRYHDSYVQEFQTFVERLNSKEIAHPDVLAGVMAQAIAEACQRSVDEGRVIKMEEVL
ncbi:MAG: Gfo/Idh/MocA family oxidoreductase [Actinomycetaceae bacterium]|nr:Gfo/Idh/MocA family oxidoreductase [Actinomycetaceae bacterium]